MAGLALCLSDLAEMSALLRRYRLGVLIPNVTPKAIAAAINSLTPEAIDTFKQNALVAAQELNWERERETFVSRFEQVLDKQMRPTSTLTA
jgi:hypothetical protein